VGAVTVGVCAGAQETNTKVSKTNIVIKTLIFFMELLPCIEKKIWSISFSKAGTACVWPPP
jgi:hypothetical protein